MADEIDPDAGNLFEVVIQHYGNLSGIALSSLTHRPESPWSKVWKEGCSHIEIPNDIIREHYLKLKDRPTVYAA